MKPVRIRSITHDLALGLMLVIHMAMAPLRADSPRAAIEFDSVAVARSPITALAFCPQNNQVLAASQQQLQVLHWPSLELKNQLQTQLKQIHHIQFSPDGQHLLVCGGTPSEQGEFEVFSWPQAKRLVSNNQHDDVIYSAAWCGTERFATGAADLRVNLWQLQTDSVQMIGHRNGHSRRVLAVAYLKAEKLLVTAGVDQTLRVWDGKEFESGQRDAHPKPALLLQDQATNQSQPLRILDNHTGIVRDLAVRPGDFPIPYVASVSADKTVRIWQPTIGRLVRFARLPVEPLSVTWSADGKELAAGCIDGKLRTIDPNSVQIQRELPVDSGWVYAVAASPDGGYVVGGTDGRIVRVPGR